MTFRLFVHLGLGVFHVQRTWKKKRGNRQEIVKKNSDLIVTVCALRCRFMRIAERGFKISTSVVFVQLKGARHCLLTYHPTHKSLKTSKTTKNIVSQTTNEMIRLWSLLMKYKFNDIDVKWVNHPHRQTTNIGTARWKSPKIGMIVIRKITVITLMIILSPCTCCEQLQYTVTNYTDYEKKAWA